MNAHDCLSGCEKLIPADYNHPRVIPARFALEIPWERPGSYAKTVKAPILFAICGLDTVAPPKPTLAWAKTAPNATIKWYDGMGHFDIYVGEAFERASADYVEFLQKNLPVTA
jgi:pimeloyl-ACP methyl ester carboxylesterase